jgi:tetratricopeptide (TPR) repeat protein
MSARTSGIAWIALATILALVAAQPVLASDLDEARRHYAKGTKAYEIGAYDEAIKEYGEAYKLIDDPALLFNLGQAHRLAGHTVEALRAYRMFLLKVPDSPNRTEVQQRIGELQQQAPTQPRPAPAPAATETAPKEAEPATGAAPAATATSAAASAPAIDPAAAAAGRKKLIAGGVVAGAGVAIVVGGIVCGVLAQSAGNDLTHAAQMGQPFDYNKYQAGKTDQTLEIALIAVGGAAVVAGATVMVLGRRQQTHAHAWLRPMLGPGTAGLALDGGF